MSKPVKKLIRKEIADRLDGVEELAVVSVVGIGGNATNRLRGELLEKGIRVLVVQNAMARQALAEQGLGDAAKLLDGPSALAIGGESVVDVAREIKARTKDFPALKFRGAMMEGALFGPDSLDELASYPTRPEALGKVVGAVLGAGGGLVGSILGPGRVIAGLLKSLEESKGDGDEAAA